MAKKQHDAGKHEQVTTHIHKRSPSGQLPNYTGVKREARARKLPTVCEP